MTDCGIFILEYMERFCEDPEFILDGIPDTIDKLNWFPSTLINKRRDLMAEFLININTKSSRVPPNSEKIRVRDKNISNKNQRERPNRCWAKEKISTKNSKILKKSMMSSITINGRIRSRLSLGIEI